MWNTYDPMHNPLAGHEEEALPPAFIEALAQEMKMNQDEAVKRYRHAIGMARRIDFLFSMAFMSNACLTQELFGKPATMGDPTSSDHYGVLNTYTYRRKGCEQRWGRGSYDQAAVICQRLTDRGERANCWRRRRR